jgi:tetratricopeptide (TPR) repeat protein
LRKGKSNLSRSAPPVIATVNPVRKHLLVIAIIGAVLRILFDLQLPGSSFFGLYFLDSEVLQNWALDIYNGNTPDTPFFRAPLYPYFLALIYKIFGLSVWAVIIVQNVLGILTAIISYSFANRLFGSKVALLTGIIVVSYPTLLIYEAETMMTSLEVFLYTWTVYLMFLSVENPSKANLAKAGIVFGLAAITRPVILPLAIIWPIAHLIKNKMDSFRETVISTAVFACFILIPIIPVTLSNYANGEEFILISTQGGSNFYVGNSRTADGISVTALGPQLRIGKYRDNVWTSSVDEAHRRSGKKLTEGEVSSFWYRETFHEISSNFSQWLVLCLKKFYYFWHGQEIYNVNSLYYASDYSFLMKILLWKKILNFPSGLLFPLMFLGCYLAIRNKIAWPVPILYILLFSLVITLFFVCARFRQPIIPVAVMFASSAIMILSAIWKENRKTFLAYFGTAAVLAVILNAGGNIDSKQNLSQFEMVKGGIHLHKNNLQEAIKSFENALEIEPLNMAVFDLLGEAYLTSRNYDEAERIYKRAHDLYPEYSLFNFGLGQAEQYQGDLNEAKKHYFNSLKHVPNFAEAHEKLGSVYELAGQIDSAVFYYKNALRIQRRNPSLSAKIQKLQNKLKSRN